MESEWEEWAAQFEASGGYFGPEPARCLYAKQEGPHRTACRKPATHRSRDGYPACEEHQGQQIRNRWKGFVRGA